MNDGTTNPWEDGAAGTVAVRFPQQQQQVLPDNANDNIMDAATLNAALQQREQRQRSIRFLMMFLLMLTLMDGEDAQRRQQLQQQEYLRTSKRKSKLAKDNLTNIMPKDLFASRRKQDESVQNILRNHPRYRQLVKRNEGTDHDQSIRNWVQQKLEQKRKQLKLLANQHQDDEEEGPEVLQKDEFASGVGGITEEYVPVPFNLHNQKGEKDGEEEKSAENKQTLWHYPWNVSGLYRGDWSRNTTTLFYDNNNKSKNGGGTASAAVSQKEGATIITTASSASASASTSLSLSNPLHKSKGKKSIVKAVEIERDMLQHLQMRDRTVGVVILPDHLYFNVSNATDDENDPMSFTNKNRRLVSHQPTFLRGATLVTSQLHHDNKEEDDEDEEEILEVSLTKSSGRVAFQLYSRTIPAMTELGVVDGFVKLYDSSSVGYSTRRDVLLRVKGVVLHSLGWISLVSSPSLGRSAFVVSSTSDSTTTRTKATNPYPSTTAETRRRRLEQAMDNPTEENLDQIRQDALALFSMDGGVDQDSSTIHQFDSSIVSLEDVKRDDEWMEDYRLESRRQQQQHRRLESVATTATNTTAVAAPSASRQPIPTSKIVFPFPYVMDDKMQSIGRTKTPAARSMPPREQLLEANAGSCEFELSLNIQEESWTVGQWRSLLSRHVQAITKMDPANVPPDRNTQNPEGSTETNAKSKDKGMGSTNKKKKKTSRRSAPIQDQALVMILNGTIHSTNCDFHATINATAVRTDWESTTSKAINYSFYMMLTCLTQIVLLLRQLLHSQSQSAATRVSLLCIGWQTVLDALLCLIHIYLSLAMQTMFTAFASVAFFKLLIFCVIEMKYMAIIIQARNSTNGGGNNTLEMLRRQIAMLHLRFYVALLGSFIAFFYAWEAYRTIYMLVLYSFWVPQIIYNIVTEAKRPLHQYYVYGMSLTRMVPPLYVFAVPNNFLKEVYPDSPTSLFMCELLVLWVGIQAAVLEMQGRYGARFMIPARFLPPKFDYNRPIPPSLLPPEPEEDSPSAMLHKDRAPPEMSTATVIRSRDPSSPRRGARNRMKGSRMNKAETPMTTETISTSTARPPPSFDCVICYNEIDIRNRTGYMLAPCDHLFHKDCLVQWMEVKMECPICRKDLPAL